LKLKRLQAVMLVAIFTFSLGIVSIPQTHASSIVQNYPSACSGSWTSGSEAYVKDSSVASCQVVCEVKSEEYWGFGFDFGSEEIVAVFVEVVWWWQISISDAYTDDLATFTVEWNTSSGYVTVGEVNLGLYIPVSVGESSSYRIEHLKDESFPIVASVHNVTVDELNDAKVRVTFSNLYYYSYAFLDVISIEVAYTTPTTASSFSAPSVLAGFLLLGLPLFTIILAVRKRDLDQAETERQMQLEMETEEEEAQP